MAKKYRPLENNVEKVKIPFTSCFIPGCKSGNFDFLKGGKSENNGNSTPFLIGEVKCYPTHFVLHFISLVKFLPI
jgi:hypothetical protein